jgi:uncharacterized protein (TIGR03790 family)
MATNPASDARNDARCHRPGRWAAVGWVLFGLSALSCGSSSRSTTDGSAADLGGPAVADLSAPADLSPAAPARDVLVIINDQSPTSIAVGNDYLKRRALGDALHIQCADSAASEDNETLAFADYRDQLETPLRDYLAGHPTITFIVTTRGVPIRIAGAAIGESFSGTTMTSLDSYLAALDYDQLPDAVTITFNDPGGSAIGSAWLNRYWNAMVPFTHAQFGGYLVTRLDGYNQADAEALVTHALLAEQGLGQGNILLDVQPDFGLGDATMEPAPIVDTTITQESGYDTYNADMIHAQQILAARQVPVMLDLDQTFVGGQNDLLGYFSWGSNDDHFDPAAYTSLLFAPGAIGDTAVSTSARSFFLQTDGQSMIADLIAQGITGVKGYSDEPLLQAIASPTIALDRYTGGWTLAESFYAASHFVGWTDVVIGDPLTRPYPSATAASRARRGQRLIPR